MCLSGDKSGWECFFFFNLSGFILQVFYREGELQELHDILKLLQRCILKLLQRCKCNPSLSQNPQECKL